MGPGGEGADLGRLRELHSPSNFQVGVTRIFTSVGPLSLWERARVRALDSRSLRIKIENADPRQQIRLGQIRMLMPAQRAIHQPMTVLNIEGEAANETLLLVVGGDEVQTILVFSVKHDAFHVCFEARMVVHPHDEAVTQDSHRSIAGLFVVKKRRRGQVSVESWRGRLSGVCHTD